MARTNADDDARRDRRNDTTGGDSGLTWWTLGALALLIAIGAAFALMDGSPGGEEELAEEEPVEPGAENPVPAENNTTQDNVTANNTTNATTATGLTGTTPAR